MDDQPLLCCHFCAVTAMLSLLCCHCYVCCCAVTSIPPLLCLEAYWRTRSISAIAFTVLLPVCNQGDTGGTGPPAIVGFGRLTHVFESKQRPKKITVYCDDFRYGRQGAGGGCSSMSIS